MVNGVGPPHASLVALHFIFLCVTSAGNRTQGLACAKQVLYCWGAAFLAMALDIARHVFQQPHRGGLEVPSVQDVRGN